MRSTLLIIALTLVTATTAMGQDNPQPKTKINEPHHVSKVLDSTEIQSATNTADKIRRLAMHDELRSAREQVYDQVMDLGVQITQSASPEERMELQRQVMRLKSDATLQSMTIQLKYARLGEFTELAEQLETNIELFQTRRGAPRGAINTTSTRPVHDRRGEVR